jgi:hypothetical protein
MAVSNLRPAIRVTISSARMNWIITLMYIWWVLGFLLIISQWRQYCLLRQTYFSLSRQYEHQLFVHRVLAFRGSFTVVSLVNSLVHGQIPLYCSICATFIEISSYWVCDLEIHCSF